MEIIPNAVLMKVNEFDALAVKIIFLYLEKSIKFLLPTWFFSEINRVRGVLNPKQRNL